MIVYRLARAAHAALDGEGARLYGARWNSPGRPMVYTAASPSLAVLEVLVHLDLTPELLPDDYRMLTIEAPDEAPLERLEALGPDTDAAALGDAFLARGERLMLQVPSVVVPQEANTLFNPRHPQMARVRIIGDQPFGFDPRLLGAG